MKTLKDILKNSKKTPFTPTGTEDDKLFKASNVKQSVNPNHGYVDPQDKAAWKKGQSLNKIVPYNEETVAEKIDHSKKYEKTEGDRHVARYQVTKNGKKVGYIKHTKKGEEHEKMAFFPLGATKARAYNSKRIPGDSHKQKIAHMIKMHVKEEAETSIEAIMEKYKVGERMLTHDPYAQVKLKNRVRKPKKPTN
jgi:hypothetical protein